MSMFCYQCQEAAKNEGCQVAGICGKTPELASLQDLLVWSLKGVSFWAEKGRQFNINDEEINYFVAKALFYTITNVNFDRQRFADMILEAIQKRDDIRSRAQAACKAEHGSDCQAANLPDYATWSPKTEDVDELERKGTLVGVLADLGVHEDIRSLRELLVYGLKGLAAYVDHAYLLDKMNDDLLVFIQQGLLAATDDSLDGGVLTGWVLSAGEKGVQAMALLSEANTGTYGDPEPTVVNLGVKPGPAILISGHDLRDLHDLLEQTKDTGINVYTHGEMLPANAYPAFKKFDHFVGNYGGAWYQQREEFEKFNGAILLTTNCLVPPKASYKDRLYTTGHVGYEGVTHIEDRKNGQMKDFSVVIERAKTCESPEALETGSIPVGFGHKSVLSVADKLIEAVKAGAIKRFVVMAGCDGRHPSRQYYTDFAEALPKEAVILTAGCAKYRYNKLDLGDIGGIPRVLDAGQCNDSYSLVVIAQALAEAFGVEDINDLPISYNIAWYEQKAVIVLLALLYLGVKNIHLGPSLPAFLSPGVINVLVNNFNIQPMTTVENDLEIILNE